MALIVAVAMILNAAPASAGSCAAEIAQFRQSLHQKEDSGTGVVGSAPQSIDAQLEHQPTPASVARAKHDAKGQVLALLAQAEAFDAQGRRDECQQALQKANLLLNP
jgi:hypothetical protein